MDVKFAADSANLKHALETAREQQTQIRDIIVKNQEALDIKDRYLRFESSTLDQLADLHHRLKQQVAKTSNQHVVQEDCNSKVSHKIMVLD